jgi:hypothetical protein
VRYVAWFNMKYARVGHLFQDRFKSEAVETDSYFVSVLRYLYQNPVKAGLCRRLDTEPPVYADPVYADTPSFSLGPTRACSARWSADRAGCCRR